MILAIRKTECPEPINGRNNSVTLKCAICDAECWFQKESYQIARLTQRNPYCICNTCFEQDPLSILTRIET